MARAIAQVTRLDRLVDSILASVRGEGLAAGLARVAFDVARAVNDTVAEMTPLLRSHPMRRTGTWDALVGIGDEGRFRQVLEHLLENEVKYSPEGGAVSIGVLPNDNEVHIYVTDDGPGIPESEWESVFDAYVRWNQMGTVGVVLWSPSRRCAKLPETATAPRLASGPRWVPKRKRGGLV